MPRPFERVPYSALPNKPLRSHGFEAMKSRELDVESRSFGLTRVHVREFGHGPPLLLVHGLMTSSYSFRYVVGELGASYRVVAIDLPGAGRSASAFGAPSFSPDALADFIIECVDALAIRGCRAVGNSL